MALLFLLTLYAAFHFYLLGGTWGDRLMREHLEGPDRLLLGLMLHYVILSSINFFLPIGFGTTMLLTIVVVLTTRRGSRALLQWMPSQSRGLLLMFGLLMLVAPYWVSQGFMYDHYLYHEQTIKWFNRFPVPAGLTNLHGRLGFNNAAFPIASSFQTGLNSHWYFMNAGLFVLFLYKSIRLMTNVDILGRTRMGILILTGTIVHYVHPYLSGSSPDLQVAVLMGYLFITLAGDGWSVRQPGFILSLLAFMVVMKVNVVVFAISLGLLIFWRYHRQYPVVRLLLLPVSIGMVWVLRSLVMSGQLLYPFPGLHLTVFDHSVPLAKVEEMRDLIVAWGRSPGPGSLERYSANSGGFGWVREWYTGRADHAYTHLPGDLRISLKVWLWLVVGVGSWSIIRLVFRRNGLGLPGILIFALMANVVFWFLTGPDFRFAYPIFHAILFVVMVSGAGGDWVRRLVFIFLLITLPFQLKDVGREYISFVRQFPQGFWWSGSHTKFVGDFRMREGWIPSADGLDSFRYEYPVEGDRAPLDVFPAAPGKVEGVVFERRGGRLEFRVLEGRK